MTADSGGRGAGGRQQAGRQGAGDGAAAGASDDRTGVR